VPLTEGRDILFFAAPPASIVLRDRAVHNPRPILFQSLHGGTERPTSV